MLDPTDSLDPVDRRPRVAPPIGLAVDPRRPPAVRPRRSRRWRAAVGGSAVAVVLAGGAVLVAQQHARSGRPETVIAGPDPAELSDGPVTVHAAGLQLRIDAPRDATVGTRIWLQVTLSNSTNQAITVAGTGPCDAPVTAAVVASGTGRPAEPSDGAAAARPSGGGVGGSGPGVGPAVAWDGSPGTLAASLGALPAPARFGDASALDCGGLAEGGSGPIAPGRPVTRRIPIDLRWGTDRPHGAFVIAVDTGRIGTEGSRGAALHRSLPIQLHDNPVRAATAGQVSGAKGVARAPTLGTWVVASGTPVAPSSGTGQSWSAALGWWNGRWETWIWPRLASASTGRDVMRITWDPVRHRVVDVRTIPQGQRASDDPDHVPVAGGRQEAIRYHVD
ncbi:hypothetical protein [Aquihabitans sp. McL0605]|uniref:hypothetical protein n=1 Tax=Aquihabitans sp. McL0605 TaxID=3415671 RepID=UPI003CEF451E